MKLKPTLLSLAILLVLLGGSIASLPAHRPTSANVAWAVGIGGQIGGHVQSAVPGATTCTPIPEVEWPPAAGGDFRIPVYAHEFGRLTRVGDALREPGASHLEFYPYADRADTIQRCPVAYLVRANLATLWRLQSDEERQALRDEAGAFLKAVGEELRSVRNSPVFATRYEPRLQAIVSDALAETLKASADEGLTEDAVRQAAEAACAEVLPVMTSVAVDLTVQGTKDYMHDLSLDGFVDSAKEAMDRIRDDEPWIREEMSEFVGDVMADPRTTEALGRAIETVGRSHETTLLVERAGAGFATRLLADERLEQLMEEAVRDPDMAPYWEALSARAGDAFGTLARALVERAGGDHLDPFVATVLASMLYGREGPCVIMCSEEASSPFAGGDFTVLQASNGRAEP